MKTIYRSDQESQENSVVNYRPLIDDMTWSYSRVECFDSCPYKWFMKYISGQKGIPMFYSSFGSFIHKLLEQFYKGEITKEEMSIKFLFDFQKEVQGERPGGDITDKYIEQGYAYLLNFQPLPYEPVEVEKRITFRIGENKFIGFIDYLGEKGDDLYIVDHKSRALKPRTKRVKPTLSDKELDEKLRQLYIYSVAIKDEYGKFPKALCFNCYRTNVLIEEEFEIEKYNEAIKWVEMNIEYIKSADEFFPQIDFYKCKYLCELHDSCCYWNTR